MNNLFQSIILLLFLFWGVACKSMDIPEQFNANDYLLEAKECLNVEGSKSFYRMDIPSHLIRYLEHVEIRDYVGHTFLDPNEVSIDFKRSEAGDTFSISLHIDLNKNKGCDRISIYEISG